MVLFTHWKFREYAELKPLKENGIVKLDQQFSLFQEMVQRFLLDLWNCQNSLVHLEGH